MVVGKQMFLYSEDLRDTFIPEREDQGGTDEHISPGRPGSALRGRIKEERRVPKEEEMLTDQTPDGKTTDVGRGGACKTQKGGGHGAVANKGVSPLYLPGDLVTSRQINGNT